ncbi:MAG: SPOR domain-containing protein [Bacteroidota bacterium]
MNFKKLIIFSAILFLTLACSSSKDVTKETTDNEHDVYIFDDVSNVDTTSHEAIEVTVTENIGPSQPPPPTQSIIEESYIVQVGAFSTEGKAEIFVNNSEGKIKYQLTTVYSEKVGLYVVQLPPFKTREEAEKVRNELWEIPKFSDSFIVPK